MRIVRPAWAPRTGARRHRRWPAVRQCCVAQRVAHDGSKQARKRAAAR